LANIVHEIEAAGAHLKVLEHNAHTLNSASRAFFGMLAIFSAFEIDVRRGPEAGGQLAAPKIHDGIDGHCRQREYSGPFYARVLPHAGRAGRRSALCQCTKSLRGRREVDNQLRGRS